MRLIAPDPMPAPQTMVTKPARTTATDSLNYRMWIARSISAMRSEVDASQLRQQVH